MIKIILIIAFLLIIVSLGSALFHLVNNKSGELSPQVAKALTVRIILSVLLFAIVFILVATGLVKPHGIGSKILSQTEIKNEK
jgi:hypothetical protein